MPQTYETIRIEASSADVHCAITSTSPRREVPTSLKIETPGKCQQYLVPVSSSAGSCTGVSGPPITWSWGKARLLSITAETWLHRSNNHPRSRCSMVCFWTGRCESFRMAGDRVQDDHYEGNECASKSTCLEKAAARAEEIPRHAAPMISRNIEREANLRGKGDRPPKSY
jgi:hypothetical protein